MQAAASCYAARSTETLWTQASSSSANGLCTKDRCPWDVHILNSSLKGSVKPQRLMLWRMPARQAQLRRARTMTIMGSGKASGQPPREENSGTREQEAIKQARNFQLEATELLAQLLQAKDLETTARANVDGLTESFFMIASTYLDLAKKEGNAEVVSQLESTLKVALNEKEKTLRPEIRLLNRLLRETSSSGRDAIFREDLSLLGSDDGYFADLVKRMLSDVERQPENPRKGELLRKLKDIKQEVKELVRTKK